MAKILVAHSSDDVLKTCRALLEKEGYWVLTVNKAQDIPNKILSHRPDLVLLKTPMEMNEGANLIPGLRSLSLGPRIPIVALSSSENQKSGHTSSKPIEADAVLSDVDIDSQALSTSIRNLLERHPQRKDKKRFFQRGQFELDHDTRAARLGSAVATDIPKKLFDLLWLLAKKSLDSNEVLTRKTVLTQLWKGRVRDREVDVTISRLKNEVPFISTHIKTIPGIGYRLSLPGSRSKA